MSLQDVTFVTVTRIDFCLQLKRYLKLSKNCHTYEPGPVTKTNLDHHHMPLVARCRYGASMSTETPAPLLAVWTRFEPDTGLRDARSKLANCWILLKNFLAVLPGLPKILGRIGDAEGISFRNPPQVSEFLGILDTPGLLTEQ